MIKGKILLVIACLVALVLTAGGAYAGYVLGAELQATMGAAMLAYDWNLIKIVITAVCGALVLLVALPGVITARQVNRMYGVSRKYAKWSPVTIVVGLLMLLITAGLIALAVYEIGEMQLMITALLTTAGLSLDILTIQIGAGVAILAFCLLLFLPLLISLRGRDSVSALLKKKHGGSAA